MKVLVSDSVAKDAIKIMEDKGLTVDVKTGLPEDEIVKIIGEYDAMIVRSATKVTAKIIDAARNLKVIARGGVGVDNIDCVAAEKKGIKVVNTPNASTNSVAELAVGMMFAAARFIAQADASMKKGGWEKKKFEGTELAGKTVGVIGAGRIGTSTAQKALAMGMKVVAYDPMIQKHSNQNIDMLKLDDLLARADYLTLHVPFDKTKGALLGKAEFQKMKKGVIIINASRGKVIDEAALLEAIKNGTVAQAAVDVWAQEPTDNKELVACEQVIALPHLGASTKEGQQRVGTEVAARVVELLKK
jgi:D-3-phosphoglycerate dehydrogenase / 2-oxoglutarate reductase